jgi:hypothetical protein
MSVTQGLPGMLLGQRCMVAGPAGAVTLPHPKSTLHTHTPS